MKQLHTIEEVKHFDRLYEQAVELKAISIKYNNTELLDLSDKYNAIIELELHKYDSFVGLECTCPDSTIIKTGGRRKGEIDGKFYFNAYSKSVRCNFKYASGGFDTHSIIELDELIK